MSIVNMNGEKLQSQEAQAKELVKVKEDFVKNLKENMPPIPELPQGVVVDAKKEEHMTQVIQGLYQVGAYNHHQKVIGIINKYIQTVPSRVRDAKMAQEINALVYPKPYYDHIHQDVTVRVKILTTKKKRVTTKKKGSK